MKLIQQGLAAAHRFTVPLPITRTTQLRTERGQIDPHLVLLANIELTLAFAEPASIQSRIDPELAPWQRPDNLIHVLRRDLGSRVDVERSACLQYLRDLIRPKASR